MARGGSRARARAARRAPRGGPLRAQRGARGGPRAARGRRHRVARAPRGARPRPPDRRARGRRPRRLPVRRARGGARGAHRGARAPRGRSGGRAAGAGPRLPHRPRPRARLHVAAQLPGARRPRPHGTTAGHSPRIASSAASSCRRAPGCGTTPPTPARPSATRAPHGHGAEAGTGAEGPADAPRGPGAAAAGERPHRRGHRPDRRDRQAVHRGPGGDARRRARDRHGAPAVRPRLARMDEDRVPPRATSSTGPRSSGWSTAQTSSCTSPSSSSGPARTPAHINVEGSRNVFEAAAQAGAQRLVYASSVAAYGFPDVEGLLDEEMPAARSRAPPLLRPQGRGRARAGRRARGQRDGRVRVPAVHRRRARGAAAGGQHPLRAARPSACRAPSARCSTRCRS